MQQLMDFSLMPPPKVIEQLDYEKILKELLIAAREIDGWSIALESDPVVKLLEIVAYRELMLRGRVNDAVKATTLASATGTDLEYLGANVNTARLSNETDNAYRYRIQLAFNRMAAAGPAEYYRQHALSITTETLDVGVHSPAAGEVVVTVLGRAEAQAKDISETQARIGLALFGAHPEHSKCWYVMPSNYAVLMKISQLLNSDSVRPLTDSVQVCAPKIIETTIKADLTAYPGLDHDLLAQRARQSLADYLFSIRRIGYDLTRSGVIAALTVAGVQNVILHEPINDLTIQAAELVAVMEIELVVKGVAV